MASVMMELTEEARAHMFGPWNPYFHVTKVLIDTMDRVSITRLLDKAVTFAFLSSTAYGERQIFIWHNLRPDFQSSPEYLLQKCIRIYEMMF